jgi:DNA-binding IclR family transcriptional regulator
VSHKTDPSPRPSGTGANSTADRAIEILLLFTQDKPVWTHQEISAHFEMPRSTTYRYLTSLRSNALIVQDGRGSFSLGPRLLHMAQVARLGNPVLSMATETMHELAEKFQEVVVLNERVGQEIIALDRIESPQRIVLKSTRTHLLPWPATGSAKVLLAFAAKDDYDALVAALTPTPYTEHTIRTKPQLLKHLEGVRRAGYATSDEERDQDVWGASVPLFQGGECRHALSVVGPKFRLTAARRAAILDELRQAGEEISRQLG